MAQSIAYCGWESERNEPKSARNIEPVAWGIEPVEGRVYLAIFVALSIEAGIGGFIWLITCLT
jgi:hypothetical protein